MKLGLSDISLLVALVGVLGAGCAEGPVAQDSTQAVAALSVASAEAPLPRDRVLDAYVHSMRDDLSRDKAALISSLMRLSAEEASVFWPIYRQYEKEMFQVGDLRVDALRRFATDYQAGTLDSAQASRLSAAFYAFEAARLDLLRCYDKVIAERLSPARAAQFTQIEYRIGTVIDLLIASELPLIQNGMAAAAR